MKPILIGVSGLAGSGKDTVADYLVSKHGFAKLSFADTLKDAVSMIFDLPRNLLEGDTLESREWREEFVTTSGRTPRQILQLFGTEVGRAIDPDVWVKATKFRVNEQMHMGRSVVIPDMRFPNEQDMCNAGGHTLRIEREEVTPEWLHDMRAHEYYNSNEIALNGYMSGSTIHPSEWMMCMPSAMSKMSHMILNNDSLPELFTYVEDTLQTFRNS